MGRQTVISPYVSKYGEIFHEAANEQGLKFRDLVGDGQDAGGACYTRVTLDGGWRMGTYRAFAERKKDIRVVTFAKVEKVIVNAKEDPVQTEGVKVQRFGKTYYYKV